MRHERWRHDVEYGRRRNGDEELRELRRRAEAGDEEAAITWYHQANDAGIIGDGRRQEALLDTTLGQVAILVISEGHVVAWAGSPYIGRITARSGVRDEGVHPSSERKTPPLVVEGHEWSGYVELIWRETGDATPDLKWNPRVSSEQRWVDKPIPDDWASRGSFVPWATLEETVWEGVRHRASDPYMGARSRVRTTTKTLWHFRTDEQGPSAYRLRGARREAALAAQSALRDRHEGTSERIAVAVSADVNRWLAANPNVLRRAKLARLSRAIESERRHVEYCEKNLREANAKLASKIVESLRNL